MKLRRTVSSILFFLIFTIFISAQEKGHLLIIGGGSRTESIMKKFVELAGGMDARIIIIPSASEEPAETFEDISNELKDIGCRSIDYIICRKENADADSNFRKLEGAKGIFFSGGDQNRLTAALLGTKLLESIKEIYSSGGVISGTSAGAAAMSQVMITGDELLNKDTLNAFNTLKKDNIKLAEGLGFIDNAVVDQHFVNRKRHNRLICTILENPDLIGIGIDESTAIIVNPDNSFEVTGENTVMIYDARNAKNIKTDKNGNLAAENISMSILVSGDKYGFK